MSCCLSEDCCDECRHWPDMFDLYFCAAECRPAQIHTQPNKHQHTSNANTLLLRPCRRPGCGRSQKSRWLLHRLPRASISERGLTALYGEQHPDVAMQTM